MDFAFGGEAMKKLVIFLTVFLVFDRFMSYKIDQSRYDINSIQKKKTASFKEKNTKSLIAHDSKIKKKPVSHRKS